MKLLAKILLSVLLLLLISGAGGYLYFRKKFEPAPNQLTLKGLPASFAFAWQADMVSRPARPHAALLVPVRLANCPRLCYLQFDTGAPSTLLYRHSLAALARRYPAAGISPTQAAADTVRNFGFRLGPVQVQARWLRVLRHGMREMPAEGSSTPFIIGTLGSDLLEGRTLVIDYPRQQFSLGTQVPDSLARRATFVPLKFESRRVMVQASVRGQPEQLVLDSGSSAFALLTARPVWQQLAQPQAPVVTAPSNSWGTKLTSYTTATAAQLQFGTAQVPLRTVTYIEGMSWPQATLMRFSGLTGMLGNEPFADRTVILDVAGRRFGVVSK